MALFDREKLFRRFRKDASARPQGADEAAVRRGFWPKLRRVAAVVPFAEDAAAAYYAAFDKRTPLRVRGMLLAALAYFVLPADAVPDLLPALGFTDDAAVLMATFQLISSHIQPEHRAAARLVLGKKMADSAGR
jgi:uncharacterized membrane protein YkvA (DUF1232 family)